MPDADTAVLEQPDTGIDDEPTPVEETEALVDSPETEEQAEPGETETDAEPETLTREEAERLKAEAVEATRAELKAQQDAERAEALATWQKSELQKRRDKASQDRQGVALQSVSSIAAFVAKEVDAGRITPDTLAQGLNPRVMQDIAQRLDTMAFEHINTAYDETYDGWLAKNHPGFAIPADLAQQRERAIAAGDWEGIATSKLAILESALMSKVEAKVRAEVEAEIADKQKTDAVKAAEAKQKRTGPTGTTGGTPARRNDRQILDTAIPGSKDYLAAYERVYGFRPD